MFTQTLILNQLTFCSIHIFCEDEIYKMQYASDTKTLLTRLIFVLQEKII